jgi:hypothetical protein
LAEQLAGLDERIAKMAQSPLYNVGITTPLAAKAGLYLQSQDFALKPAEGKK